LHTWVKYLIIPIFSFVVVQGKSSDTLQVPVELPALNIKKKTFLKSGTEATTVITKKSWQGTGKSLADIIQEHSGNNSGFGKTAHLPPYNSVKLGS